MKIVLVGYMGSGKSTVSKLLGEKLGIQTIDLDLEIEKKHEKSISAIFSTESEIKFRQYEHEALKEILDSQNDYIVAVGGGTPVYYQNMDLIKNKSFSIYLRMTPIELATRLKKEMEQRPLLQHLQWDELPEFIAKHLFERSAFYDQANLTVDVKNRTLDEIIEEIIQSLPPALLK